MLRPDDVLALNCYKSLIISGIWLLPFSQDAGLILCPEGHKCEAGTLEPEKCPEG